MVKVGKEDQAVGPWSSKAEKGFLEIITQART